VKKPLLHLAELAFLTVYENTTHNSIRFQFHVTGCHDTAILAYFPNFIRKDSLQI